MTATKTTIGPNQIITYRYYDNANEISSIEIVDASEPIPQSIGSGKYSPTLAAKSVITQEPLKKADFDAQVSTTALITKMLETPTATFGFVSNDVNTIEAPGGGWTYAIPSTQVFLSNGDPLGGVELPYPYTGVFYSYGNGGYGEWSHIFGWDRFLVVPDSTSYTKIKVTFTRSDGGTTIPFDFGYETHHMEVVTAGVWHTMDNPLRLDLNSNNGFRPNDEAFTSGAPAGFTFTITNIELQA